MTVLRKIILVLTFCSPYGLFGRLFPQVLEADLSMSSASSHLVFHNLDAQAPARRLVMMVAAELTPHYFVSLFPPPPPSFPRKFFFFLDTTLAVLARRSFESKVYFSAIKRS